MHPFPVLCSRCSETGATESDAHFKTRVKLSWTCWYKQAGQVWKVEGELHLTGIIRIPMETACRHKITMLFYSEKWLHDNHTLLKIHSLFGFSYNFSLGEKALIFTFIFCMREQNMLPRVVDEHTRINITRQTINCRNSLKLWDGALRMHLCKNMAQGRKAEKNYCIFLHFLWKQISKRLPFPNFRLIL